MALYTSYRFIYLVRYLTLDDISNNYSFLRLISLFTDR